MSRFFLALAGWLFVLLALLGVALPLLPATPFALLAAFCFARSSERWHRRIMESRMLGPLIQDWRRRRGLQPGTRLRLLGFVVFGALLSASVCFYRDQPLWPVGLGLSVGCLVILALPDSRICDGG